MKLHLLLPVLLAAPTLLAGEPITVTEANARTFYLQYARLTKEPRPPSFSNLRAPAPCAAPPTKEYLAAKEKGLGPHFSGLVHYYANPEAARALQASEAAFPEGSVIVKEKLGVRAKPGDVDPVVDVGVMVKRAKGFDPANGDWEYFFHDSAGKFTSGKALANCAECHNAAVADHVYAAWRFAKK